MPGSIGERLQATRKIRGLTQEKLAAESGVSVSVIRKAEQGESETIRMESAHRLARALRIPTMRLVEPVPRRYEQPDTVVWDEVKSALNAPPPRISADEVPTAEGLGGVLSSMQPAFVEDRYADLAGALPPLIRDADALATVCPDEGRRIRFQVMQLTAWLLVQTRQLDAAEDVIDRFLSDAADQVEAAAMINTRAWLLLRQARLTEARCLAERWADDTEPRMSRASMSQLAAWGWMLLRVSAAAGRDNRPTEAADAMRLSHSVAVAMGREHRSRQDWLRTFGPGEVARKRAENASIAGSPDEVLRLSETTPVTVGGTSSSRNRHHLDVASAQVDTRDYTGAVQTLHSVWRASPEWLPHQQSAHDIMHRLIARKRSITDEMRELADAIRLVI